jgi:CheY-like chemotaxis protein
MPLMDGFQFLDEFERLMTSTKQKCRIVMLTSSINPQDVNRSKKYSNVKLYLNKPLTHESIMDLSI